LVFKKSGDQCVESLGAPGSFYILDQQVPASTFALMSETISP
jgi:hypothetical protein